jgi:hypothetical protein
METTLEVRWFGPDHVPDLLSCRFDDLGAPGPRIRTDTYLLLPGTDDLGVKLREGGEAFELKLRQHDFGDAKFVDVAGNLERWQKWSFSVGDPACREVAMGLPSGSLVDVEKGRRLLTYRLAPDGSVGPVDDRAGDGCSVEITTLTVPGSKWWTFGFEAFGAGERLADALTATADAFFAGAEAASVLAHAPSCGYPAWLRTTVGEAAARG